METLGIDTDISHGLPLVLLYVRQGIPTKTNARYFHDSIPCLLYQKQRITLSSAFSRVNYLYLIMEVFVWGFVSQNRFVKWNI